MRDFLNFYPPEESINYTEKKNSMNATNTILTSKDKWKTGSPAISLNHKQRYEKTSESLFWSTSKSNHDSF